MSVEESEPEVETEAPQRRWVALVSTPATLADDDERALEMPDATNVDFRLRDPPEPSYLLLPARMVFPAPGCVARKPSAAFVARQPSAAYILAADPSGRLLFRVSSNDPAAADDVLYFCNAHARGATRLPAVPYSRLRIEARPRRSIGLIADPRHRGHYLVAQLYPRDSVLVTERLLCYSTVSLEWSLKSLVYSHRGPTRHNPCCETGVLAHDGRLYWIALAYGVFFCDPFAAASHLRFLPLPDECHMREKSCQIHRGYIAQRRRLAPSQGLLRFVEIRGLSYEVYFPPDEAPPPVNPSVSMWTLVDPEAEEPWRFEYTVPFAEVREYDSYGAFGLPRGKVPHVALVDPDNHRVVYLLQGSKLYGLDVGARRVVSCEDCTVRDDREIELRNCRHIIDAWVQSKPTPAPTEPSSPSPPDELREEHNSDPESPSRAGQDVDWSALISYVVVDSKGKLPRGEHIRLDLQDPPVISYMEMMLRRTRPIGYVEPSAYILAADCSGRLLVEVDDPVTNLGPDLVVCDAHSRTAWKLPPVRYSTLALTAQPRHSICLIRNPLVRGEYVVAQLHPRTSTILIADMDRLLLYNSASRQWSVKALHLDVSFPDRMRSACAEATVIAHGACLWWFALGYGVFVCDVFTARPSLRFIPLPDGCEMREELHHRALVNQRRRVAPSRGQLRYVEIRGLPYVVEAQGDADAAPQPANPTFCVWTLVDTKPKAEEPWRFEYEASFAEIWADDTYIGARLPHGVAPHVALVDPNDHRVVYFFQGANLFGWDARARRIVCLGDGLREDVRELAFLRHTSRPLLDAWPLLPRSQEDDDGEFPKHIITQDLLERQLSPPSRDPSRPYSDGWSANEGKEKQESEIDWEELANPHHEVERVGFHGNMGYVDLPNPLQSILQAPIVAPLPVPNPPAADPRQDIKGAIKTVGQAIPGVQEKKSREKLVRGLVHLRKMLQNIDRDNNSSA